MRQTMLVVSGEGLGRADEDLGRRLMTKFFAQLAGRADKPHVVAFYNAGVKLLVRGSPILDALASLDHDGVELIACGTCVEHFGVREHLAVGRVSDMGEILTSMQVSDKVISI